MGKMKERCWRYVAFMVCLLMCTYANAQNVIIDGLRYYLFPDTHEAALNWNTWSGELDIPSEVNYDGQTFTVTGITTNAFWDCNELTKVRIPKTIEQIIHRVLSDDPNVTGQSPPDAMNPFYRCRGLVSIEVDNDNPIMSSEGGILYSKDKTQLYCYPAGIEQEEFVIPENVTWVGCGAITSNQYLSSLTIPNSVTYCGSVCDNCVNLKTVNLSASITYLPAYSFDRCESLSFLDIPESVQGFGESVFRWTHFEKIVIRGTFPGGLRYDTFRLMDEATILYVQQSEIEKFKQYYQGTVLPLEEYTSGIDPMKKDGTTDTVYDLRGRQLKSLPNKGVYIQNGKKVVVK